jgi:hypothetical protein
MRPVPPHLIGCSPGDEQERHVLASLVLVAHVASSLVVSWPSVAASSTGRSTASGCNAIQDAAAFSDWKNSECWQKVPRTQSHLAAGRMSDRTAVVGVNSSMPSGPARNLIGWPDATHADWTWAQSASSGGNSTVSKAHQVKRARLCTQNWCWVGTRVIPQPTIWPVSSNSVSGTHTR